MNRLAIALIVTTFFARHPQADLPSGADGASASVPRRVAAAPRPKPRRPPPKAQPEEPAVEAVVQAPAAPPPEPPKHGPVLKLSGELSGYGDTDAVYVAS